MDSGQLTRVHECFELLAAGEVEEARRRHDEATLAEARRLLELDGELEEAHTPAPKAPDAAGDGLVGTTIAGFELTAFLGDGASGQVFLAHQQRPSRQVALKLLWPSTRAEARDHEREIAALASLEHPGIARLYQVGMWETAGAFRTWLAMEHVEGGRALDAELAAGLSIERRVGLLAEVADAVAHAHGAGVIHRDLKPANILLDVHGRAVVIDFGLARRSETDGRTVSLLGERVVGTLAYMAPEALQAGGRPDGRGDVFALGAIAWEILAGRSMRQLAGMSVPQAMAAIQSAAVPKLGAVDRRLRGDLERIVAKAVEPDPAQRYVSAALMAQDLRLHLAGRPVLVEQQPLLERLRRSVRRNWRLTTALVAAAVVLLATTLVSLRFARQASAQARRATIAAAASAIEVNDLMALRRALASLPNDGTPEVELLQRAAACSGELVSEGDWWSLDGPADGGWVLGNTVSRPAADQMLVRFHGTEQDWVAKSIQVNIGGLVLSPDSSRVASAGTNGALQINRCADGQLIHELKSDGQIDGSAVAWRDDHTVIHGITAIRLVDADTGNVVAQSEELGIGAMNMICAGPGGLIAAAGVQGACILDAGLQVVTRLEVPPFRQTAMEWRPDGALMMGGWDRTVRRYRAGHSQPEWTGRLHRDAIWDVASLPDGRLLSSGADGVLAVWDADGAASAVPISDDVVWSILPRVDDLWVASLHSLRRVSLSSVMAWLGEGGHAVKTVVSAEWSAKIEADGLAHVKWGDGHVAVCAAEGGSALQRLSTVDSGSRIAAVSVDGALLCFDARSGKQLWRTTEISTDDPHEPGGLPGLAIDVSRGRVLAAQRTHGCVAMSLADGAVLWKASFGKQVACVGVGGPQNAVFAADRDGDLSRLDPDDGRVLCSTRNLRTRPMRIVITPDGDRVAVASSDGTLRLFDPDTLEECLVLRVSNAPIDSLWIADDGIWTVDRLGVRRRR